MRKEETQKEKAVFPSPTTGFEKRVDRILSKLLKMGHCSMVALKQSFKILQEKNLDPLKDILEREEKINRFHIKVDDLCWKLLAQQSPVAIDLRKVISFIKMNSEFERIGDQSVNIALNVKKHFSFKSAILPESLFHIMKRIEKMFHLSLESIKKAMTLILLKTSSKWI